MSDAKKQTDVQKLDEILKELTAAVKKELTGKHTADLYDMDEATISKIEDACNLVTSSFEAKIKQDTERCCNGDCNCGKHEESKDSAEKYAARWYHMVEDTLWDVIETLDPCTIGEWTEAAALVSNKTGIKEEDAFMLLKEFTEDNLKAPLKELTVSKFGAEAAKKVDWVDPDTCDNAVRALMCSCAFAADDSKVKKIADRLGTDVSTVETICGHFTGDNSYINECLKAEIIRKLADGFLAGIE